MASVEISVGRGGKELHTVEVSSPGVVKWSLATSQYDIGVEVRWWPDTTSSSSSSSSSTNHNEVTSSTTHSSSAPTHAVVQPSLRLESDKHYYVCMSTGKLEFIFDNTFSMLRGKTVTLTLSKAPLDASSQVAAQLAAIDPLDLLTLNTVCRKGVDMFFANNFSGAEKYFESEKNRTPIFALSYATLAWLRALMTWEPAAIAEANKRLKAAQAVAEAYMPKDGGGLLAGLGLKSANNNNNSNSTTSPANGGGGEAEAEAAAFPSSSASSIPSPSSASAASAATFSSMTLPQLEASVIYAEVTLLSGLLYLMEESVMGLVRCGLSIRSGWALYQRVDKAAGSEVLAIRNSPELRKGFIVHDICGSAAEDSLGRSEREKQLLHVRSALCFGVGTFNVISSMLPPIVLKVLSFAGFPSDRAAGMACLREALLMGGVRGPLSGLIILAMRVLMPSFHSGDVSEHMPEAHAITAATLQQYPDSALFLWMEGRQARMARNIPRADLAFARCTEVASFLPQLAHLCAYELQWCKAFSQDWTAVAPLNDLLQKESNWSKAFYAYMVGVSFLQSGRLSDARLKMGEVLKFGSRKLGGRVIPAEQYAVRRAAEFLALTAPSNGTLPADEPSSSDIGGPFVRVRLPDTVEVGSAAHAAALAYPCPAAGLEAVYLFNGFPQMQPPALLESIAQADAIIATIAAGEVFSTSAPLWKSGVGGGSGSGKGWAVGGGAAATEVKTPEALRAMFDAAAGIAVNGLSVDAAALSADAAGAVKAAAATAAQSPAPAAAGGGGFFRGLGSIVSAVAGTAVTAVSSVGSAVSTVAGAVGTVASMTTGIGSGGNSSQTFANATPLLPVHSVAVAALARGAACAGLGRLDEAAACYKWIMAQGEGGRLRRDLHLYGYAAYEMGILYLDVTKALGVGAAGAGAEATNDSKAAAGGGVPSSAEDEEAEANNRARVSRILSSSVVSGLTKEAAKTKSGEYLRIARGIRDDFNWRVRLHIRVHLAFDDLRHGGLSGATSSSAASAKEVGVEEEEEGAAEDEGGDEGRYAEVAAQMRSP